MMKEEKANFDALSLEHANNASMALVGVRSPSWAGEGGSSNWKEAQIAFLNMAFEHLTAQQTT